MSEFKVMESESGDPSEPGARPTFSSRLYGSTVGRIGRREQGMLAALLVLCCVLGISNSDFLRLRNITNNADQIGMLGIVAIGSAFVIITGGIDLSVGSIIGLTGVILAKISSDPKLGGFGLSFGIGIPVTLAIVMLIGLAQGLLITRLNLQPFIVTLGGMLTLRGVSQTIVKGGTLGFGSSEFRGLSDGGLLGVDQLSFGDQLPHWLQTVINVLIDGRTIPYSFWVFLAVIIIAGFLLHFTVFGRYVYAIGGNRDASEYSGIRRQTRRDDHLCHFRWPGRRLRDSLCRLQR